MIGAAQGPGRLPAGRRRLAAYAVHLYTASGVAVAFFAAIEICAAAPDVRTVFLLLAAAVAIDATDGPLARRYEVKRWAAAVDGRTIDDIVDYLTYAFLPLLLIWRMGWVPSPGAAWILPPLLASLFGFANTAAKDEAGGFFLGFPSYWNVVAFYVGLWSRMFGLGVNAPVLMSLAVLTVLPVRFVYPNLAPRPWRLPLLAGAAGWLLLLVVMALDYDAVPESLMWLSLSYPVLYTAISVRLARSRAEE